MTITRYVIWTMMYVSLYGLLTGFLGLWVGVLFAAVTTLLVAQKPSWHVLPVLIIPPFFWEIVLGNFWRMIFVLSFIVAPAFIVGIGVSRKRETVQNIVYVVCFLVIVQLAWLLLWGGASDQVVQYIRSVSLERLRQLPFVYSEAIVMRNIELLANAIKTKIPTMMFFIAIFFAMIHHALLRLLAKWARVEVPPFPSILTWRVHIVFVWMYFLFVVLELFVEPPPDQFWEWLVLNGLLLGLGLFAVQGVAFLFYFGYALRVPWLPWVVLGVALVVPVPLTMAILSMVGVIDTAFSIRWRPPPAQQK